jgi:hypothetical protein
MKTIKILLVSLLAIVLMSASCEAEDSTTQTQECDCVEIKYTLPPGSQAFQYHSTINRPDLDCEDEQLDLVYNGTFFVKIECNER